MTTPPWKKKNPKKKSSKLSDAARVAARARALLSGRPYPNLIDNMWAAREIDGKKKA